jgi:hypothetical protein
LPKEGILKHIDIVIKARKGIDPFYGLPVPKTAYKTVYNGKIAKEPKVYNQDSHGKKNDKPLLISPLYMYHLALRITASYGENRLPYLLVLQ